jgi:hypothetical protein
MKSRQITRVHACPAKIRLSGFSAGGEIRLSRGVLSTGTDQTLLSNDRSEHRGAERGRWRGRPAEVQTHPGRRHQSEWGARTRLLHRRAL